MTWPAVHLTQSTDADVATVVSIGGDPSRLPEWAAGLGSGIRNENGRWLTDSPMGTVEMLFVGAVDLGILDHDVTLPDGTVVHNPLRVVKNDAGSEIVFTLFHRDGVSDEEFERDADTVRQDLARLAELAERAAETEG